MSDEVMPNPKAWPVCTTCKTPWVLRRSMRVSFDKTVGLELQWLWQRDCKHKAEAAIYDENGPVQ